MIISFYLPQFHPIPENDEAWGSGFSEWHNVSQAKKRYKDHYQPHLPGELGFYDLRLDKTREQQGILAKGYGIDGFCYYSYWLDGKVILGEPLERTLQTEVPDIPICLCWANENWTRAWDGREAQIILKQQYDIDSLQEYCRYLCQVFSYSHYIKIDGRPIFLIYSPDEIPENVNFTHLIRNIAKSSGCTDPYLIAVRHGRTKSTAQELIEKNYDAVLGFQPNQNFFPKPRTIGARLKYALRNLIPNAAYRLASSKIKSFYCVDYGELVEKIQNIKRHDYEIACIFPSWDNTARRTIPTIIQNTNPLIYSNWLSNEISRLNNNKKLPPLLFINAWNEWAEGCHLEPDRRYGRQLLEATRKAVDAAKQPVPNTSPI